MSFPMDATRVNPNPSPDNNEPYLKYNIEYHYYWKGVNIEELDRKELLECLKYHLGIFYEHRRRY